MSLVPFSKMAGRLGNDSNQPIVLQQPTIVEAIKNRPALQVRVIVRVCEAGLAIL